MDHDDVLETMRAELAQLRAEVQELRAQQLAPVPSASDPASDPASVASPVRVVEPRTSRRGMLRLAGAAAAGAAAAAVGQAGQAAAADGEAIVAGRVNEATRETHIRLGSATNGATVGDLIGGDLTAVMRLETNLNSSAALVATGSRYGVVAGGFEEAFLSYNANYTFHSGASRKAAIRLSAVQSGPGSVPKTPPTTRTDFHFAGEMEVDGNGDLWWCVSTGTPGTWRKLSGPTTAGAFHAINPARVYDSRVADGALGQGASRVVSVADGRDANGVVTAANVVPVGSTAIAYNITVADTVGAGFLAVAPGNSTGTSASSINWSASGQLLANGLQVGIFVDDRTVRVFSGGAGSTQFIIDVVGYYR